MIPILNKETNITELLNLLKNELGDVQHDVIVVDADSDDKAEEIAEKLGACFNTQRTKQSQANEFWCRCFKGRCIVFC